MTRTEQAPEPTMEEILASIRLIISDDAKRAPSGPEDHPSRLAPPRVDAAPLNALPEEEVLDLTDALAPEEQPSPNAPSRPRERYAMPAAAPHEEPEDEQPRAQEDVIEAEPEPKQEADISAQPQEAQPSLEPRHDLSHSEPPASRTIWSRRELPGSPRTPTDPDPRYEAPARQPQRSWAQDIQMPIPDRGPVSLVPGQAQPHVQEPEDERETAEHMEAAGGGELPHGLGEREAAVAAIAESLARTAAGAMDSEELATAGDVDFSKLGEEQKAEVTETFANAIHAAPRDRNPLPTLLDEVLRQDFIRELSPDEEPAEDSSETEASRAHEESHEKAEDTRFAPNWGAPEIAFQAAAGRESAPQLGSEPPSRVSETSAPQEKAPVWIAPIPQPDPDRSAESGSPLEAAVRDMLRPLLDQWLDKHMPRVLESAIREEIAARGLLSKAEK